MVGKIKELLDLWMRNYDNRKDIIIQIAAYLDQKEDQHFNVNLPFLEFLLSDMKGKFEGFEKGEYPNVVYKCQLRSLNCVK